MHYFRQKKGWGNNSIILTHHLYTIAKPRSMGNGVSSVMKATGGGVLSQASCLGGENFQTKLSMLKETPLGKVLSETDLAYFSSFFSLETLVPHCRVPMCAGELLVVGEGEVQVYVIQAGLDAKTKEQSFVLCTKRKGDLIWVPSVTRLAKQKSSSDDGSSGANYSLPGAVVEQGAGVMITNTTTDISFKNSISGKHKELHNIMYTTYFDSGAGARTKNTTNSNTEVELRKSHSGKHKDLYNIMDTTYIDSLYGAILLKVTSQWWASFDALFV